MVLVLAGGAARKAPPKTASTANLVNCERMTHPLVAAEPTVITFL
jgi:hypothetical protein